MTETRKTQSSNGATTVTVTKKSRGISYLMNILSYVAVIIGGLALFIAMILAKCGISANFINTMTKIANCVGWLVLCVLSTKHAFRRGGILRLVIWIVAVVMIFTSIILI